MFKKNPIFKIINEGFDMKELGFIDSSVKVYGSAGKGRWSDIPWIAICDLDITDTVKKGFFLVYLFSYDMSEVYLSLNQGWGFLKEKYNTSVPAAEQAREIARYCLNILGHKDQSDPMKLKKIQVGTNDLSFGYEAGEIYSYRYEANNLPSNEELLSNVKSMWSDLERIKQQLINPQDVSESVEYILASDLASKVDFDNKIKELAVRVPHVKLKESDQPLIGGKIAQKKGKRYQNKDYVSLHQQNTELGFFGEKLVLEFEREKLKKYPELLQKINHVSVNRGDGDGYDIHSFNSDGSDLFIEVKTTNGNKDTSFYMSQNEVEFARSHPDNYVIYRIYDFTELVKNDIDQVNFYQVRGKDFEHRINLKPINYQVKLSSL